MFRSWISSAHREAVTNKIDEALQRNAILSQRNGKEMEHHIFEKATNKEEYLMLIVLLVHKIRDYGLQLDGDFAGPSYTEIEQPVVDLLSEIPELAEGGLCTYRFRVKKTLEVDLLPDLPLPSLRSGSMLTPGGRSAQSEKYKGEYSWKTPAFRNSIISKFDQAMYRYGRPTSKSSMQMERLLFEKAKSREEYTAFAGRVLLHIREMGSRRNEDFSDPPVSDIRDLIPDPFGDFMAKLGHLRRVQGYPPYCYSGLHTSGTPKNLVGGG